VGREYSLYDAPGKIDTTADFTQAKSAV